MTAPVSCRCANLSLRLSKYGVKSNLQYRYISSSQLLPQEASTQKKIVIPNRIRRSDTAILDELAKTVKQESGPNYRYHDDPYLLPYGVNKMTRHAMAKASGQKAAQYVINTYPYLFYFNPVDAMGEFPSGFKKVRLIKELSLEKLQQRIMLQKPVLAHTVYKSLKYKGETIPQDVCEDLLGLLCLTNGQTADDKSDLVLFMEESDKVRNKLQNRASPKRTWRDDGEAESVFQDMEEPSPRAYNYLVRGRAKYGQSKTARDLFKKMKDERIPVSLETYNAIIQCPADEEKGIQYVKNILQYMKDDGIIPSVHTVNNALNTLVNWEGPGHNIQVKIIVNEVLNEMKALNIEPNLTTWLQLLTVYYPGRNCNSDVLTDILDELKDKHLTLSDELDYEFFANAMEVCFMKQDIELAYKLNDIVNFGDNKKLLGRKFHEMKYQSSFIRLMSMFEQIDTVMEYFNRTQHLMFPVMFTAIIDILKAIELNDGHRYIPQLWVDFCQSDLARKRDIIEPILDVMSKKQEEKLQAEYLDIADTIREDIEAVTDDRGRLQSFIYTGSMFGHLIQIYLNGDKFDSAWNCFKLFKRNRIKIEGFPTEASLKQLIGQCIEGKKNEHVLESLAVMADGAYPSFDKLQTKALKVLDLSESERKQMEDLD